MASHASFRELAKPSISIVVPSWNNSGRLRMTLEAIAALKLASCEWEVVVVNNNSTDDTAEMLEEFAKNDSRFISVFEPIQGLSQARNCGIHKARGDFLVFADDDIAPAPDWLDAYCRAWRRLGDDFFYCGPVASDFQGKPPPEQLLALAPGSVKGFDLGPQEHVLGPNHGFLEANWACSTNMVRRVGGFDVGLGLNAASGETRVGEGRDLASRLRAIGMQCFYVPGAAVKHFVPASKSSATAIGARARANARHWFASIAPGQASWRWAFRVGRRYCRRCLERLMEHVRSRQRGVAYVRYCQSIGELEAVRDVFRSGKREREVACIDGARPNQTEAGSIQTSVLDRRCPPVNDDA
jgi:GT2 family glycosyltransferase